MVNNEKTRIGINDITNYMRKHPQAERIERLNNKEVHDVISIFLESIEDKLLEDKDAEIALIGHFTFSTKEVEAEEAKTIKSFGKEIKVDAIPAHRQLKVKISSVLKKR